MLVALLLCLVGIAVAQRPVPCTTPTQWEGRVYDTNDERNFRLQGRLTYDAQAHRERFLDEVEEGSLDESFDTITLFDLQVEYVFNFRARNCTRRAVTRPWRNFGINPNDTNYGEAYIGSSAIPGANVLTTIWGGSFPVPGNQTVRFVATWTYEGCVPVARTIFSPTMGVSHISFYDVVLGIRDPNVFIPRRECLTDEEWANRYALFGTTTN